MCFLVFVIVPAERWQLNAREISSADARKPSECPERRSFTALEDFQHHVATFIQAGFEYFLSVSSQDAGEENTPRGDEEAHAHSAVPEGVSVLRLCTEIRRIWTIRTPVGGSQSSPNSGGQRSTVETIDCLTAAAAVYRRCRDLLYHPKSDIMGS